MPWTPRDIIDALAVVLNPALPVLGTIALALLSGRVKRSPEKDETATDSKEVLKPSDIQAALMFQLMQQAAQIEALEKELALLRAKEVKSATE